MMVIFPYMFYLEILVKETIEETGTETILPEQEEERSVDEIKAALIEKEKLLDDAAFCRQWIRYRLSAGYGPSVIRRELRMKGISAGMIDEALADRPPEEEDENAVRLALKAWKRTGTSGDLRKNRQKVIASLVRKGYGWDTARAACEKAENELE